MFDWLFGKKNKDLTAHWTVGPVGQQPQHKESDMALILTATQQCPLQVTFKDAQGNPAAVESGEWSATDPAILTVTPDAADLTKALVKATGVVGTGQVNVRADARFGPETKEIIGVLDVEVVGAEATVVEISAGTPEEQGAAPEPQGKRKK
jgi:hypothetical protein